MSGNGYGYYYPSNSQNYPTNPEHQSWNWSVSQQQQYSDSYNRGASQYHTTPQNHAGNLPRQSSQNFYPQTNNRYYQQHRRFSNNRDVGQFSGGGQPPRNTFKRPRTPPEGGEPRSKASKKKKKPLSQNVPSKKDWTIEEATEALNVEKEYNKRFKNHSLIIKFPDLELNRDIVTQFHPSIENVHFQQPSTPRFCFVTLEESADAEKVIQDLNKVPFGQGFLTAEYKKDREEDQNIGPEDIDPCTLYVGNLAQEITKEDMVKTYPKCRRIDIGYAKKMKYTRYAFVSFKNVPESVEAFKKTHSTQMHSKSLIVRFRRLHGTVGMPGESKLQTAPKSKDDVASTPPIENSITSPEEILEETNNDSTMDSTDHTIQENNESSNHSVCSDHSTDSQVDLSVVKHEVDSDDESYTSPFMSGSIEELLAQHRPIKTEIVKTEVEEDVVISPIQTNGTIKVKEEPEIKKEVSDEEDNEECGSSIGEVNFSSILNQLENRSSQIESLRKYIP